MPMTGAEILADAIHREERADCVFFVDAVLRRTLLELRSRGVSRIHAHSEKAAAYMADGYARVSGKTGFCMAQSAGAANLAAGLQDAYLDHVPVVALTGRKPDSHQHRNAYQEVRHTPFYEAVTALSAEVRSVDDLPRLLARALATAHGDTHRPVHLDLDGLTGDHIEDAEYAGRQTDLAFLSGTRTGPGLPTSGDLLMVAEIMAESRRPLILCGSSSLYANAGESIKALAAVLNAPIATSAGGRSVIETSHPQHVGVMGAYSAPYANQIMSEADLVIFVGCQMGDQITSDWTLPCPDTVIIQIDSDRSELGHTMPGVVGVAGDLSLTCSALAELYDTSLTNPAWCAYCVEAATSWLRSSVAQASADAGPIPASRLAYEVGEALPKNGIVLADTGLATRLTAQYTALPHPGQSYYRAGGSLGWAFPAAIGASLGSRDRPVVCFTGGGAFYHHIGELETMRRWNVPLVTVINNNATLRHGLRSARKQYENRKAALDDLVAFEPVNFCELAGVFGIKGIRVEQVEDIRPALDEGIALKAPVVIDVVTDPDSHPEPAWRPQ